MVGSCAVLGNEDGEGVWKETKLVSEQTNRCTDVSSGERGSCL